MNVYRTLPLRISFFKFFNRWCKKLKAWWITRKPIELTEAQVKLIKFTKGHYKDRYPYKGSWVESLKEVHNDIYGWDADEHYRDYLGCIFNALFKIHMKIRMDGSGEDVDISDIFKASFYPSISREDDLPIERAISELCGKIQCSTVRLEGYERFSLDC